MVPIAWRMKRRQLEAQQGDTSYAAQQSKVYPSTSSCSRQQFAEATKDAASEVRRKRVKIRLPRNANRLVEQQQQQQQGSSGQRFAVDDKPPGFWHTV